MIVKYRPHRGSLDEAMKLYKEFSTIDEMYEHILSDWNSSGFGELFSKEDLSISESMGDDERIGWKNYRYVCVTRIGNDVYDTPQCIGMCSIVE